MHYTCYNCGSTQEVKGVPGYEYPKKLNCKKGCKGAAVPTADVKDARRTLR